MFYVDGVRSLSREAAVQFEVHIPEKVWSVWISEWVGFKGFCAGSSCGVSCRLLVSSTNRASESISIHIISPTDTKQTAICTVNLLNLHQIFAPNRPCPLNRPISSSSPVCALCSNPGSRPYASLAASTRIRAVMPNTRYRVTCPVSSCSSSLCTASCWCVSCGRGFETVLGIIGTKNWCTANYYSLHTLKNS